MYIITQIRILCNMHSPLLSCQMTTRKRGVAFLYDWRYNGSEEDALRYRSIQGTAQAGRDGPIEDIMALLSRSR
jgi:hypothetical protein